MKKIKIITEAGSGIGKRTAILFAEEGARVIVTDVNEKGGNERVDEIKKNGEEFFAKLDVTNREQSKQMVKTTLGKYGRIDVLTHIPNCGILYKFTTQLCYFVKYALKNIYIYRLLSQIGRGAECEF